MAAYEASELVSSASERVPSEAAKLRPSPRDATLPTPLREAELAAGDSRGLRKGVPRCSDSEDCKLGMRMGTRQPSMLAFVAMGIVYMSEQALVLYAKAQPRQHCKPPNVQVDAAHLVTMRAASVSSRKLFSIRDRAISGSAISFHSHTCAGPAVRSAAADTAPRQG